jgi:hypothetical protein
MTFSCLGLLTAFCIFLFPAILRAGATKEPTYWQDIRPILRKNCAYCHAERHIKKLDVSGGLALDSYQAVLKGSKHKVISPGQSKDSRIVELITAADARRRMPLDAQPLSAEQIALIRRWIDTGAREGQKPAETSETTIRAKSTRRRKLDVNLLTTAVPPAGVLGKIPPGPLGLRLKVGPLAPVTAVAFSRDGRLLATGCYGQVTVWDLQDVRVIKVLTDVLGTVNDLAFSPDGKILAAAGGQPSARGEVRLFQIADWKPLASFRGHTDVVFSTAFSPDGNHLATASFDTTVRVWDVPAARLEKTFTGHSDFVYALAYAPDGKIIASASKDRSVRLTNVHTGRSVFTLGGVEQDVMTVAFNRDGTKVVSSGVDTGLSWWNAKTGEKEKTQNGHNIAVHELCFSKDGKLLVSAGADRTVRLWNGATGAPLRTITVGSPVYTVAIRPDQKWIVSGSFDGLVRIWDTNTGKQLATLLALPAQGDTADWVALTPEGFLTVSRGMTQTGTWTMRGTPVSGTAVWRTLEQPQVVSSLLRGRKVPSPRFGK